MSINPNSATERLEGKNSYFKTPSKTRKKFAITVYFSDFERRQIKALVNQGVAHSGTDFARMGVREIIRQNKHLLPNNMLAPVDKRRNNNSKRKR